MKAKLLLLTIFLSASPFIFGQTLLTEDFSGGIMPPAGWTIDAHSVNWSISNSTHAGMVSPEADFDYNPTFTGASHLISPSLTTTGYTSLTLSFHHYVDHYGGAYTIGVATRSGSTGSWNTAWQIVNPSASIGPEMIVTQVNTTDVGSANFQLCFFFSGNSYNINDWYLDNIKLEVSKNLDLAMGSIDVPQFSLGNTAVTGSVINMGLNPVTSASINYQVDQGAVHTTAVTGLNLAMGDSYNYTCTDLLSLTPGDYSLAVWVGNVNNLGPDENTGNDTLVKILHVASDTVARKPFYEEFTSSTCAPCAQFNSTVFDAFTEDHYGDISEIRYQMNWPGAGDPYYTAEGGVRRFFYGCNFVPDLYVDGKQTSTTYGGVYNSFENSLATPAFININSIHSFTVQGTDTSVTVHMEILPKISGSLTAYAAVIEKITYHNATTNGETQFHNVMMKMVPNAYGTPVTLVDNQPLTVDVSADLAGTNIERWSDLMVVVWIQDSVTRQMFQAGYTDSVGVGIRIIPGNMEVKVYPNPSTGKVLLSGVSDVRSITVYDITGNHVMDFREVPGNRIDMGTLPSGLYMLQIQTRDGVKTARVNLLK
jgi:hypothetical protein